MFLTHICQDSQIGKIKDILVLSTDLIWVYIAYTYVPWLTHMCNDALICVIHSMSHVAHSWRILISMSMTSSRMTCFSHTWVMMSHVTLMCILFCYVMFSFVTHSHSWLDPFMSVVWWLIYECRDSFLDVIHKCCDSFMDAFINVVTHSKLIHECRDSFMTVVSHLWMHLLMSWLIYEFMNAII